MTLSDVHRVPMRTKQAPTDHRINRHRSYSTHWQGLITHIDEMEGLYDGLRGVGVSEEMQKIYTQLIDRTRRDIYRDAGLENIFIIERHEQTQSDIQAG